MLFSGIELTSEKRGAVTILVAVGATAMIGMAAFAVETSNWYLQRAELQRVADAAATAAAIEYVKDNGCPASNNGSFPCYQAAKVYAVMNGIPASSTTVTIASSPTGDGNQAILVTVSNSIPLMLSRVISNATSVALSASAYAEI